MPLRSPGIQTIGTCTFRCHRTYSAIESRTQRSLVLLSLSSFFLSFYLPPPPFLFLAFFVFFAILIEVLSIHLKKKKRSMYGIERIIFFPTACDGSRLSPYPNPKAYKPLERTFRCHTTYSAIESRTQRPLFFSFFFLSSFFVCLFVSFFLSYRAWLS